MTDNNAKVCQSYRTSGNSNLLNEVDNLVNTSQNIKEKVSKLQRSKDTLVFGLVSFQQRMRMEKKYEIADTIRAILKTAGIEVIQGTQGYIYSEIPQDRVGRPIGDTWKET